jgi:hypothetical protein
VIKKVDSSQLAVRRIIAGLVFVWSLVIGHWSFSQASSPYSRFGLGYVRSTVFSANKAMGDLAAPYASAVNINYTNPASYASLTRTTIEVGFNFDGVNIYTKDSTYRGSSGSVNHFAIALVPNSKRNNWAISLGLLPYTNINYSFAQNFSDSSLGSFQEKFTGKGSLYQVYVGGAYRVKGFSIGANVGFLFGNLEYEKAIILPSNLNAYNTRNQTNMNVKSFMYNVGVQYQKRIYHNTNDPEARSDIFVTAGAYGSAGLKLTTKTSSRWERYREIVNVGTEVIDIPEAEVEKQEKIPLPFNVGAGVMFGNERFWLIGTDFKFMNWKNFHSPLNNDNLDNGWRVSIGGQIIPKSDDRKYFNRVQFRLGTYFGKSEINPNGGMINEVAGTVGLGFPFKSLARLNLSADIGTRGGSDKSVIRETFYKITFGLVLNDIWFIKRKFD